MKVTFTSFYHCPPSICAPCGKTGAALLAIAALGALALLAASALYTVKEGALVFRDPSEALGNIQNLADLILTIAGKR